MNQIYSRSTSEVDWLTRLIDVVPPPLVPSYSGSDQLWLEAEERLRSPFPKDYKRFLKKYGSGVFSEHLAIYSPFCPGWSNLFNRINEEFENGGPEIHLDIKGQFDTTSLCPLGHDPNRGFLYWIRIGEPDEWPLFYTGLEGLEFDIYHWPLTKFLYCWQAGLHQPSVHCGWNIVQEHGAGFEPSPKIC